MSDELLEILNSPTNTGGSGTGCSYYQQVLRCPRRAHLNQLRQEEGGNAANTGTAFHRLMEWYYGGRSEEALAIEVSDMSTDSPVEKALHMFRKYTEFCGPDFFGRVIGTEVQLPEEHENGVGDINQVDKLTQAMGITPWTGRLDLVCEMEWEGQQGVYLVDFKTTSRRDGAAQYKFENSLQAMAYMMAWDVLNPGHKCSGMIFQYIVSSTTKKDGVKVTVEHFFVPPPTEKQQRGVRQQLQIAKSLDETDLCFWTACSSVYGQCPYLNVECDRTLEEEEENG